MILGLVLKFVGAIVAIGAVATGGYYLVKEQGIRSLAQSFEEHLETGDYLAALGAAENLRVKGGSTPELEQKITEAARLLVAENVFVKAKQAAQEKRYADASALLRGSDAISDATFRHYDEARKLYEEAEALAAGAAHKAKVTTSALEDRVKAEASKREAAERAAKEKDRKISASEAATKETVAKLEAAKRDVQQKEQTIIAEQARAKQLMEQVEKESRQKFMNELKVYRDMAEKGKLQLDSAMSELQGKRDVTALVYVSQGRILFEEVRSKAVDLRAKRTPAAYVTGVDDLIRAVEQLLEAAKHLRNAVVYVEDQGSAEFTNSSAKAKAALGNAAATLSLVSDFIASHP